MAQKNLELAEKQQLAQQEHQLAQQEQSSRAATARAAPAAAAPTGDAARLRSPRSTASPRTSAATSRWPSRSTGGTPSGDDGMNGDPDVLLAVPVVKVDSIHLQVDDLDARVSLNAQVLDLVNLQVGVHAHLGKVRLDIKGVEAQALVKVRLDHVAAIIDRVLTTIDRNPELVENLARPSRTSAGVPETRWTTPAKRSRMSVRAPRAPSRMSARAPVRRSATSAKAPARLSRESARARARPSARSARVPARPSSESARAPARRSAT